MTNLGRFIDVQLLLIISGIESNPGPSESSVTSHPHKHLLIAHVNINSITAENKIDELQQFVDTNCIKILSLTEAKLDDNIPTSQYKLTGFHTPLTKHRNRHGGGVAIYIHSSLPFERLSELELDGEEWLWAKIRLPEVTLLISCIYLPPNLSSERLNFFIDNFNEATFQTATLSDTATFILGDFNTGNIFLDEKYQKHNGITPFDYALKNSIDMANLRQIITQPTRINNNSENLRDLVLTNCSTIVESGTLSSFSQLDHFPVYASIDLAMPKEKQEPKYTNIWDYSKMDAPLLTSLLLNTDWESILNNDVDTATEHFVSALHAAATASIPVKRKRQSPHQKPWLTAELRRGIRKRDRLFKIAKQTPTDFNWERWKFQRNRVTQLNKQLKGEHLQSQVKKLTLQNQSSHNYHQTLRTLTGKGRDDDIPPLHSTDGNIVNDDFEKASLLNKHFARQSTLDLPQPRQPIPNNQNPSPVPSIENITTSENEVLRILNALNVNKSTGPDGIPVKLLKLTALLISGPLARLFNMSLASGKFPEVFKKAHVKPIFKNKGSPSAFLATGQSAFYRPCRKSLKKLYTKMYINT